VRGAISEEGKASDDEFAAAVEEAIGGALTEGAKRPLSDEEKAAIVRIKNRLDDQIAALKRK
jgi:hypothetical protein